MFLVGGVAVARAVTRSDSSPRSITPRLHHVHSSRPEPATFTFVGGGDIALTGNSNGAVLAGLRPFVRDADLVIGNLEGTLATGGAPRCLAESACFTFRGSPAWARALRATGFNVLTVANNHALDYGVEGQRETLAALRGAHIVYAGLPGQIAYVRAGKVKVALIGCAPYRWAQSLLDVRSSEALVRKASRHANVVLVYMHAGAEGSGADHVRSADEMYLGEGRGNAWAFAHTMIRAGADAVFASGPHVLRGIEWYRNRLIAFSLGNLAGTHTLSTQGSLGLSALLRVTLDEEGRFTAASVVPLRLAAAGTPVFDHDRLSLTRIRVLSRQDFGHRAVRILRYGRIAAPR